MFFCLLTAAAQKEVQKPNPSLSAYVSLRLSGGFCGHKAFVPVNTYRLAFLRQNAMYETLHGTDMETHGFAVGKGGAAVLQAAMTLM